MIDSRCAPQTRGHHCGMIQLIRGIFVDKEITVQLQGFLSILPKNIKVKSDVSKKVLELKENGQA